jgi:hypothetical protein
MQPGQQKISQFDPATSMQSGDIIPFVRNGQNKRITVDNFTGVVPTGWLTPAEVWTYTSYNSTTRIGVLGIPAGAANRYPTGTRIWFKQGSTPTNRYAVVISSTASTLTIHMLAGYTLDNSTIIQPYASSIFAPITPENVSFGNVEAMPDFDAAMVASGTPQSVIRIGTLQIIVCKQNVAQTGTGITFVKPFALAPHVLCTTQDVNSWPAWVSSAPTTTGVTLKQEYTNNPLGVTWMAIGPAVL